MDIKDWTVALVEPNRFEAQIQTDILKNAGVTRIRWFRSSDEAAAALELYPANIIIFEFANTPQDGEAWTKAFRRNRRMANRKASIFMLSHAVSRQLAETCRHAGANAIIGKPLSGATLLATIKKVLGAPRPFIDAAGYVGPCRRAGIVTAGLAGEKSRRETDKTVAPSLPGAVAALASAAGDFVRGRAPRVDACAATLRLVQEIAAETKAEALAQAAETLAAHLAKPLPHEAAFKAELAHLMDDVAQVAAKTIEASGARDALAESVRRAEARAEKAA